jgi:hypothetical protein
MTRVRSIVFAILALAAVWAPASSAAYDTRHCKALGYCELELPASRHLRHWYSPFRLPDESEFRLSIYIGERQIVARRIEGCRAWYSSPGLRLRALACHRGWSRIEFRYRSAAPVYVEMLF